MTYNVIILSAGIGSRLRPLTFKKPKSLLEVGGLPIIDHQILSFAKCGIKRFHVVVGYKATMLMKHLSKSFSYPDFEFLYIYNPRYIETNTAYSLWLASSLFVSAPTFIVNGDLLINAETVMRMLKSNVSCIGYRKHKCGEEEVKLRLMEDRVFEIGKGLCALKADGEYVGIAMFDRKVGGFFRVALDEVVKSGGVDMYYDDVIQKLVSQFYIKGVDLTDLPVMEIDTIEELEEANVLYEKSQAT
ncbi:MAG: phosphocholine cytidylyltransferase family protein [Candidatus Bathyarchaeia archaeon]